MRPPSRRPLDETDVRVRPNRQGTRPRSKLRPEHADAEQGFVVAVDRGRYTVLVGPDEQRVLTMKARELGRLPVVPGDRVAVVGDTTGAAGSLARIVRIEPRGTVLRRTADDDDPVERIIVANADQLVVVTALADPAPHLRMIDRCVVAAYDAGMAVLLVLTKADLAVPDDLLALYEPVGVHVLVTTIEPGRPVVGLELLRAALSGHVSVLVGHSGVGKSTLVNQLVPAAGRATGVVNDVTGRGRHTSSSAVALRVADARPTWVIDTPGVRSFGLGHVDPSHLLAAFDDLDAAAADCPRDCSHAGDAPDCVLDDWVRDAPDPATARRRSTRLTSFRRLLASRLGTPDGDDLWSGTGTSGSASGASGPTQQPGRSGGDTPG